MGKYKRMYDEYNLLSMTDIRMSLDRIVPYMLFYKEYLKEAPFYSVDYLFQNVYSSISKCVVPKRGGLRLSKDELFYLLCGIYEEDWDNPDEYYVRLIDDVNYNLILEPKVPRTAAHLVGEKTRKLCMWVATVQNLKGEITKEELAEELYKLFDIPEIDLNHKPHLEEEAERFYNLSLKIKNHNL